VSVGKDMNKKIVSSSAPIKEPAIQALLYFEKKA
jgi:hypothetical protein